MSQKTMDVVIPSYKPGETFDRLMKSLLASRYPIQKILVMNTEQQYFPEEKYQGNPKVQVIHLKKSRV